MKLLHGLKVYLFYSCGLTLTCCFLTGHEPFLCITRSGGYPSDRASV